MRTALVTGAAGGIGSAIAARLARALTPEDCGGAVAFLASGEAATMPGQTICPDGGPVLL